MNEVNYAQPIEIFKGDRVFPAWVSPDYRGAGAAPIEWEGCLEATSANQLGRMGWRVRNR